MIQSVAIVRVFSFLLLALLIAAAGCGSGGRAAVHGKVTLDGQPVENGSIAFISTGKSDVGSAGGSIVNGEYTIPANLGPAPGPVRVELRWSKKTGRQVAAGSPSPAGTMIDEAKEAFPAKFNTESTLTREIKGGNNEQNFELATK